MMSTPPKTLGPYRYQLLAPEPFFETRMSLLWLAEALDAQQQKRGKVVIKVARLQDEQLSLANQRAIDNEERWLRKLQHPGIIKLRPIAEEGTVRPGQEIYRARSSLAGDPWFVVTDYLPGGTLQKLVETRKRLSAPLAVQIARALAATLAYVHAQGCVHRDFKPQNILFTTTPVRQLDEHNQPILIDFGIANALGEQQIIAGTRPWLAPECDRAMAAGIRMAATPAMDIYALGLVLYYMLTGKRPPDAAASATRPPLQPTDLEQTPSGQRAALAVALNQLLARAVDAEADKRLTAQQFIAALDTLPITPAFHPLANFGRWLWLGGAAASIVTGLVLFNAYPFATVAPNAERPQRTETAGGAVVAALPTLTPTRLDTLPPTSTLVPTFTASATTAQPAPVTTLEATTQSPAAVLTTTIVAVLPTFTPTAPVATLTPSSTPTPTQTATTAPTHAPTPAATSTPTPNQRATLEVMVQQTMAAMLTTTAVAQPPTASATPTPTPTDTVTRTPSPTVTPMPTATPTYTLTPNLTATLASIVEQRVAAALVATASAQPPTATPTVTPTASATPTLTPTPTASLTPTPVATSTPTPNQTATLGVLVQETVAAVLTATAAAQPPTPTATESPVPTATLLPTLTPVPTPTASATATPLPTLSPTPRPTRTPTATVTPTLPPTSTLAPTLPATPTTTPTATPDLVATQIQDAVHATLTALAPPTITATVTATATPSPSKTPTARPTRTPTPRPTAIQTATPTSVPTVPPTPTVAVSTATPTRPPAPAIPAGNVTVQEPLLPLLQGRYTFRWTANFTLRENQGFELIFWLAGQDPLSQGFGPVGAGAAPEAVVNLDKAAANLPHLLIGGKEYEWGVLLVELSPYRRLRYLGGGHRFRFELSGDSSGGGSSGGGSPPTPTPRG